MSYKAEVIADRSGQWVGNGLRFETQLEAEEYAADLMDRWTLVRDKRVVESDEPVNVHKGIVKLRTEHVLSTAAVEERRGKL